MPRLQANPSRIAGDRQLVASVPGVVLASAVTAAAVVVEIVALWHTTEDVGLGDWSRQALIVLAGGVVLYCVSVAASITLNGRWRPLLDDPTKPAAAATEGLVSAGPGRRRQLLP